MKTLLIATMAVCVALTVSAQAVAGQLYAVRPSDGASLSAVEELGAVVRHVGVTEMVVEGDARVGDGLNARGLVARRLPEPRATDALFLCYPMVSVERLSGLVDVVWSEPEGAAIVSSAPEYLDELRLESYVVYPLPVSVNVASWFDNTPPAHISGRSQEDERAVRGVVRDVISSVSADSVMAYVTALSEYSGGTARSRFMFREECLADAKPYIMSRLDEYLPTRSFVDTQRFTIRGYTCEDGPAGPVVEYPADNIIGVLPGTGRLSGYYIICAHYDATALHSFPENPVESPWFWWCENPAPGADDNATGVAAVLEAARALAGLSFPFDIRFVLFSGEELGLYGSAAYADSAAGYRAGAGFVAPADTIYGVLNVDMIGYKNEAANPDTCHIIANAGSMWLADWIADTAELSYPDLFTDFDAVVIDEPHYYSDHASFWVNDYDAVLAIEHSEARGWNPNYHTVGDLRSDICASQLVSTARMLTGALARLSDPDGRFNLAVFPDDVVYYATHVGGTRYRTDHFVIGEPAEVRVDFHAFGPDVTAEVTLEVWDGAPDDGTLLSTVDFTGDIGGGEVLTHEFGWELEDGDLGDHLLSVRVTANDADETTVSDNVIEGIPLRIDAPRLFIADHFAWPNPAADVEELNLSYRLSRGSEGSVEIRVFDLLGQDVTGATMFYDANPDAGNEGLLAGMNTVDWASLSATGVELTSGVYIYRITTYDRGGTEPADTVTGKFAIVR